MGQVFQQWWEEWGDGLITSLQPDEIPPTAFPAALNTELVSVGAGRAIVAKRRGCRLVNETPITGSAAILHGHDYQRVDGGSSTSSQLLWTADGRLERIDLNGNTFNITTGLSANLYPSVITASNRCYWVNGTDRKKFDGLTVSEFGITRPSTVAWSTPTAVSSGGTTPDNSTYEIALTYGNSVAGAESSRSEEKAVTTGATGNINQLSVTWTAPTDPQVDKVYVYIRKTNPVLNSIFLRVGEFAASALTATFNAPDSVILNLIITAPGVSQADPPPAGVRYLAFHEGRIFAADDYTVYYSLINERGAFIEAFDAESARVPVNPGDGQRITGLHNAHEMLLVFKEDSVWAIFGTDPATWEVRQIIPDIGAISHRSIVTAEGVTYWWSEHGPMMWPGSGKPEPIGEALIRATVTPGAVNYTNPILICAALDIVNQRILFAVPTRGEDRADAILPFNYRLSRWESGPWDPIDPASLHRFDDSTGKSWVFLGGYAGQLFRLNDLNNDGLPSGTTSTGTFTAAATTHNTITDGSAAFTTTGGALIERKVTVVDATTGVPISTSRARITSNTATVLTLNQQVGQLTVGSTYRYYIGGPDWQWDLKWEDFGDPFYKKRYEFLYLALIKGTPTSVIYGDLAFDYSTDPSSIKTLTIDTDVVGTGVWDSSLFNQATWGALFPSDTSRERVARVGKAWRVRLRNHEPNSAVVLRKLGIRAERLTDKR